MNHLFYWNPFPMVQSYYCEDLTASLFSQNCNFDLPAVMGVTGIALLSQSTMIQSLWLEKPPSVKSHNLLRYYDY